MTETEAFDKKDLMSATDGYIQNAVSTSGAVKRSTISRQRDENSVIKLGILYWQKKSGRKNYLKSMISLACSTSGWLTL